MCGSERKKYTIQIILEGSFEILRCGHFDYYRTKFHKSNIGWPQQPPTEKVQKLKNYIS